MRLAAKRRQVSSEARLSPLRGMGPAIFQIQGLAPQAIMYRRFAAINRSVSNPANNSRTHPEMKLLRHLQRQRCGFVAEDVANAQMPVELVGIEVLWQGQLGRARVWLDLLHLN